MKQFLFIALGLFSFNSFSSEFTPYTKSFEQVFEVPVKTKIIFAPGRLLTEGYLAGAICYPWKNEIKVDKAYWSILTIPQRMQLVFHELGHCTLFLAHSNEKDLREGCKASIMNPTLFTKNEAQCFVSNFKYYILEMIYLVKTKKFIK